MDLNYKEVKSVKKVPTFNLAFEFIGLYILFTVLFGIFSEEFMFNFLYKIALFRDSTFIFTLLLYYTFPLLLFIGLGYLYSKRVTNTNWKLFVSISPVPVVCITIWCITYFSTRDLGSEFGNFSWILYTLATFWSNTGFTLGSIYINNKDLLAWIGLLPAILPSLSFLLGILLSRRANWKKLTMVKKSSLIFAVPILLMMGIFTSFFSKSTVFTEETYPKVDGATAAIPFAEALVRELTGASMRQASLSVDFNKSHEAYVNLIKENADIIFVSGPSDQELQLAREHNVELQLTPIGRDAFIFLVHNDNTVTNLTVEDIQEIYSGKITNWSKVGGESFDIKAYQRNENSGSQTFMEKQVMKGLKLADPPLEQQVDAMGGLINIVADFKNAKNSLGYSFYYFANEMHKNEKVKFLKINGIEVNKENIINETYPFTATLYAVTREGEPEDSAANQLLKWILSEDGSRLIEKGGFVPVN